MNHKNFILLLAILLLTIGQFTTDIYLPSVPTIIHYFHTSTANIQLTITIYYIGYGLSQFFYGPLSDNYGRRPVIFASLIIYLAGTALCLTAQSVEMLLLGRFIQGAGIGGAATIAASIPHDIFTGAKIGQAFSYIGIAIAVTPLIAPILGGYFQVLFGWKSSFIFLFSYALLMFVVVSVCLPETNRHARTAKMSFSSVTKNYAAILSNKIFLASLFALIVTLLGEIMYIVWMPIILQNYFHLSPVENGWMMIFPALGLALGGFVSTFLCKHKSQNYAMISGVAIITLSTLCFSLLTMGIGLYKELIIIMMSFYMIGSGISFPLYISICTGSYPKNTGTAGALMSGILSTATGFWGAFLLKTKFVHYSWLPHTEVALSLILASACAFLLYLLFTHPERLRQMQ